MSCACWLLFREDRPVDKRDRAILMLFIAYGLRAGEVGGLRLDDLDWENEMLRVRCPKPGRTHFWPLSQGVGHAILRYIRRSGHPASGAASSSHRVRQSSRLAEAPSAKSSVIVWQVLASSPVDEERMRCGMLQPSIFWIRACR